MKIKDLLTHYIPNRRNHVSNACFQSLYTCRSSISVVLHTLNGRGCGYVSAAKTRSCACIHNAQKSVQGCTDENSNVYCYTLSITFTPLTHGRTLPNLLPPALLCIRLYVLLMTMTLIAFVAPYSFYFASWFFPFSRKLPWCSSFVWADNSGGP